MKLKSSFKYMYEFYKQSLNTQKFVLIFVLSIILSFYGVLQLAYGDIYILGFFNILLNGKYVAILFLIILLNTNNIYAIFEKNQFLIIRLSSKRQYLKQLLKNILFSNLWTIILNIILVMIGLNLFNQNTSNVLLKEYNIAGWIYIVFAIIKLIVMGEFISVFSVLLYKIINNKIVVILNIVLCILIMGNPFSSDIISSIVQLPLFIGSYLIYQLYSSFLFEILCFCLYFGILCIIFYILKYFVLKYMKDVVI